MFFKMKFALYSRLSVSANSKRSQSNFGFLAMFSFTRTINSSTEKLLIVAFEKQISCRFQKINNAGNCQNKEKKIKPTSGVAVVYY